MTDPSALESDQHKISTFKEMCGKDTKNWRVDNIEKSINKEQILSIMGIFQRLRKQKIQKEGRRVASINSQEFIILEIRVVIKLKQHCF